MSDM
jgi:hypothetical protein